jgi:NAD(P)-dependent dehydrogenase (short-subunit alcohol dehydrogenase family)
MGRMQGLNSVVTGGARGIGEGIVRRFVAEGGRCVIADIDVEAGELLAAELGDSAIFVRTDVTSEADILAAIDACIETFGSLDVMINNAGVVGVQGSIIDTELPDYERTMAILLTSVYLGTKHAMRVMKAQGHGAIINTSSTAGVQGGLGPHIYTTAKHGVIGLSKSVAVEAAPHGIRVNVLCPGATLSSLTAGLVTGDPDALDAAYERLSSKYPGGKAPRPEDMANAAVFLASDEGRFMNGAVIVMDAGKEVLSDRAAKFYPAETTHA